MRMYPSVSMRQPDLLNLQIYTDPKKAERLMKLINFLPHELINGYATGALKFAKQLYFLIHRCMAIGCPPGGVSWPPLAESTMKRWARRYPSHSIYYLTGFYHRYIQIITSGLGNSNELSKGDSYYFNGSDGPNLRTSSGYKASGVTNVNSAIRQVGIAVGLRRGLRRPSRMPGSSKETMTTIARILENGSSDGRIPARPLWYPAFQQCGGTTKLKQDIVKGIRDRINHYKWGKRI